MTLKSQFLSLKDLLTSTEAIWSQSVIQNYPKSIEAYNPFWIDEIVSSSAEKKWAIDTSEDIPSNIENNDLKEFLTHCHNLTIVTKEEASSFSTKQNIWDGIKKKKKHEISQLIPFIEKKHRKHQFTYGVDIGAGKGHLAHFISQYCHLDIFAIDMFKADKKRRIKSPSIPPKGKVEFIHTKNPILIENESISDIFQKNCLTVGLHTCGSLALQQIINSAKNSCKAMLNIGCCYDKLDPVRDTNLSTLAKKNPLNLNLYALSLATRVDNKRSFDLFKLKTRVNYYRYALELLLREEYQVDKFLSVGNLRPDIYSASFAKYAEGRINYLGLPLTHSEQSLNDFYKQKIKSKTLDRIFAANLIRWRLGRVLELYLLIDRCLFTEELGGDVKLVQFFNQNISPRNIGIYSEF